MTAPNVHSDSRQGDLVGLARHLNANNVTLVEEIQNSRARTQEINRLYNQLPANQTPEANVNFLGSSYSGVDIKVVAHLYDSDKGKGVNSRLAKLVAKRDTAQAVADGCQSLLFNGINGLVQQQQEGNPLFFQDYSAKRELFVAATGLDPIDPNNERAIALLTSNIFKNGNFTFLGGAQMKRIATQLRQVYRRDAEDLRDQVKQLEEIEAESTTTVVLASLQTISVQSFREKNAVRALGHAAAKGYTRGARTIGGSMIYTIFNEHALADLVRSLGQSRNYGERDKELSSLLPDQLPPLDLTIVFANEYGSLSDFRLFGVEWVTDGSVFSIDDLLSEQTMNFVCRDADIMTSRGRVRISRLQRGMFDGKDDKDVTGTALLFNDDRYRDFLDKTGTRRRLTNR